jgi:hypothetical protein
MMGMLKSYLHCNLALLCCHSRCIFFMRHCLLDCGIPTVAPVPANLIREGPPAILTTFLYFSTALHIEFLCATTLQVAIALGLFVMRLAGSRNGRNQFHASSNFVPCQKTAAPAERISDIWLAKEAAEKNRPSVVLWEAARTFVLSVGVVVLLMVVLSVLHFR